MDREAKRSTNEVVVVNGSCSMSNYWTRMVIHFPERVDDAGAAE